MTRTPRELKHLSTSRSREYSVSSGERKRRSPNRGCVIGRSRCSRGVVGPSSGSCDSCRELQIGSLAEVAWKGLPERVTAPYAKAIRLLRRVPEYHVEGLFMWEPGRTTVQG